MQPEHDEHDRCEICGRPMRVCILEGYAAGAPVVRRFCLECADRAPARIGLGDVATQRRFSIGSLLMVAGVLLAAIVAAADYLGAGGSPGLGLHQLSGLVVGAVLVFSGALCRVEVMLILGILVFTLAACADLLGLAGAEGIGWKQQSGFLMAAVMVALGVICRRRA